MDIFKIIGLGIAAATLAVIIRRSRPELATLLSLAATAVILMFSMPYLKAVLNAFRDLSEQIGLESKYITLILKIIGIAYTAQFGAEICRDAGESAVASKLELAGKLIIMTLSLPIVYKLLEVVGAIVRFG